MSLRVSLFLCVCLAGAAAGQSPEKAFDAAVFKDPPARYRGHAMWGFNLSNVTRDRIESDIRGMAGQRFGGFFVEPHGGNTKNLPEAYLKAAHRQPVTTGVEYLDDDYMRLYGFAMEEAKKNGMHAILYDDWFFPTGTVSGQLYTKYPQYMAKRLDMVEKDVTGPVQASLPVPKGTYIGAVLMNRDNFQRIDVSAKRSAENVACDVPKGNWKLMVFYLNHDAVLKIRNPGLVDYLDDAAMNAFLSLSYDRYYVHLKQYFGNVIGMSFYDEPSLHWLNGRTWTPAFNAGFAKKYGRSPMTLYPALWYDIGPETAAARNALFGFRAQLYAEKFVGKLAAWCHAHGIRLTGHMDQEEVPNPVPTNGDLMKVFEHQDIPGADDIFYVGRSNPGYKIVTSAAFNYDKPVVMTETYAAYTKINDNILLQAAMDQAAMGVSFQVPSGSIARRAKTVPDLNEYTGRLGYMLRHGRHVADIAVLYPIAALQSCYKFIHDPASKNWTPADAAAMGLPKPPLPDAEYAALLKQIGPAWLYAYVGGIVPPEIDYMDVGESLYRGLRVDYTYLHPEVLEARCTVRNGRLVLNNKENREEYRVLVIPGGDTLPVTAARKIQAFYRGGGAVIATSKLAVHAAEFGQDGEVLRVMHDVFGTAKPDPATGFSLHRNRAGGRAYFLPKPDAEHLSAILKEALPLRDVAFAEPMWQIGKGTAYDGALTYIHKVKEGRDIYFFANSSEKAVNTRVVLRGSKDLAIWNPHTGAIEPCRVTHATEGKQAITEVQLVLAPVSSRFFVEKSGHQALQGE